MLFVGKKARMMEELDSRSGMRLSGGLFWLGERGAILRFIFPSWHVCRRKSSQDSGAWKMRLQCADVRDPVDGTSALLYTSQPPSNLDVSDMISPMASKQDLSDERVFDGSGPAITSQRVAKGSRGMQNSHKSSQGLAKILCPKPGLPNPSIGKSRRVSSGRIARHAG